VSMTTTQILTLAAPGVSILFALGFYLLWKFGPGHARYLLYLATAFILYTLTASAQILQIPKDSYGANTMLTAALFMTSLLCLIKGVTERYKARFDRLLYGFLFIIVLCGLAYFFYQSRNLQARIYMLNFGVAFMTLISIFRIRKAAHGPLIDRAFYWTYLLFGLSFFPRTLLLANSTLNQKSISEFAQSPFWLALQLSLLFFAVVIGLILMAAAMLGIISQLQYERNTDELTKLANRRSFEERGKQFLNSKKCRRLSLVLCDLDWFKSINDTYGHHVGDVVLVRFSELLRRLIRKTDTACRLGGEEFVILMPEADLQEAVAWAEQLRIETSKMSFPEVEGLTRVTASIGVVESSCAETLENLLRRADNCLYEAKNAGRNAVIFEDKKQMAMRQ